MVRSRAHRAAAPRVYELLGADRRPYRSTAPGQFGGHRRSRIYGRLDCPSARRAIARGGYVAHRVFFADEPAAIAAGYRPCAVCLPGAYAAWLTRGSAAQAGATARRRDGATGPPGRLNGAARSR
jgi:Metal binding domain of Ada